MQPPRSSGTPLLSPAGVNDSVVRQEPRRRVLHHYVTVLIVIGIRQLQQRCADEPKVHGRRRNVRCCEADHDEVRPRFGHRV